MLSERDQRFLNYVKANNVTLLRKAPSSDLGGTQFFIKYVFFIKIPNFKISKI